MRPYRGKVSKRVFSLLLILAAALSLAPATMARQPAGQGTTRTNPRDKIHADLLNDIDAALSSGARLNAAAASMQFVARIVPGTDLGPYAERWFPRPFIDPLGLTVAAGFAQPSKLLKMAAMPGVLFLQRPESLVEPPKPVDPDVDKQLNGSITPKINTDPNAAHPGPAPNGWFHTTSAIHGSTRAWSKGYTGEGVRLMSNDSGADYCHPDLHGTWAYVDDKDSPYYGLPEMFDSYTSFVAAFDYYAGTSFIADGLAYYSDTSTEATAPRAADWDTAPADQKVVSFQPLGAGAAHSYTLPGTSRSGVYHLGSHPDNSLASVANVLSTAFGDGSAQRFERAAVLVVDGQRGGQYDRVYVDLNYNYDFTDDTPAILDGRFRHREAACLDYDDDGLNDVSGGLVYFISDGERAVPTLDWHWGIPGFNYGNGDLVAFHVMDFLASPAGNHGQGTTSVAVGQGQVRGSITFGPDGPPQAEGKGLVVGPGKDVQSTQNGDFYSSPFIEDGFIYAALGYDGESGTKDDIQIISNSWGNSAIDNDGWDQDSRLLDLINRRLGPTMAVLIATGNGAAGYGTVTSPKPSTGIGVGATTLFDTFGGFEPIGSDDQIVGGDPMSWSNRGPGADNSVGADVVATGAFGTGDIALNEILEGAIATDSFGGTSMACPVAAGNLALIYDAWRARTGKWPTFEQAKALLMGTAKNTHHDVWSQGAGLVDADEGTDAASGRDGTYAFPTEWRVGDYHDKEYQGFANIIGPGQSDTQTFTLPNHSRRSLKVRLGTLRFRQAGSRFYSFTSNDQAGDHGQNTIPDYVFRIDPDIPKGTDLLQVHVSKPYDQFDPNDDLLEPFNNWRVSIQDWTDLDGDDQYWVDENGNGHVDVTLDDDGNVTGSEMDVGEFVRFTYGYNGGPTQQARIGKPLERMEDGLLLTFRHRNRMEEVPQTDLTVQATFWEEVPWSWITFNKNEVTIPARGSATFKATIKVPSGTPYGLYEGSITATYGSHDVQIPVTVAVAATGTRFFFGGTTARNELYDNSQLFGYTDYDWREESGDWRFFWTDIRSRDLPSRGQSYLVVDNTWENQGTDIDTIVIGPREDCFSNGVDCPDAVEGFPGARSIYGPYTLEPVGGSVNTHIGSGRWRFQTSSGGPREMIAAPARPGLHGILLHQVKVGGGNTGDPFAGRVGLVTVNPGTIEGSAGDGSTTVTVNTQLAFENFRAEGFGLSRPITTTETVSQDNPNDPTSASFSKTVTIQHGALLEVQTSNSANGSDIDLFVYGPDGSLVGASGGPDDEEFVSLLFPEDGIYTIEVHGYSVPSGTDTFKLMVNVVQGDDITVSNLPSFIPAGGSATITVNWDTSGLAPGTYHGLVLMGPAAAPGLLQLPVEVRVE